MIDRKTIVIFLATLAVATPIVRASEFSWRWTWDRGTVQRTVHANLEGKPMPPLILDQWINGAVKPVDVKGKVVFVDFYATWCAPCMRVIPYNNELLKKYKDKGLVIIGVCTSSRGQEKFAANAKANGISYPAACDVGEVSAKAWEVGYFPTCALVDRKGIVRVIGLDPAHVEEVVDKLLAEPAP